MAGATTVRPPMPILGYVVFGLLFLVKPRTLVVILGLSWYFERKEAQAAVNA